MTSDIRKLREVPIPNSCTEANGILVQCSIGRACSPILPRDESLHRHVIRV